jgi:UDP-glucose 4-epimerase
LRPTIDAVVFLAPDGHAWDEWEPRVGTLSGRTAMVTGGCGFIGSHLVRRLLADDVRRVVVVDSLRYGDPANLATDGRVELVRFTLGTDPEAALARALAGVECLFHLAAEKHNQARDEPQRVLDANVRGTCELFGLAARSGVRRTVFTSSLYSYGRMVGEPFDEDEPQLPTTVYGISKLCGERLLAHFTAAGPMEGSVLRYLFVYGPRQFAGMGYKSVILRNFERILAGERPVVFGDGEQRLDYVFVDDAVDATVRAMESARAGLTLNVATGTGTSINQLTAAMLEVAGSSLAPVHGPADETAGTSRVGSPERIRAALAWSPRVTLADGLGRTLAWMRGQPA